MFTLVILYTLYTLVYPVYPGLPFSYYLYTRYTLVYRILCSMTRVNMMSTHSMNRVNMGKQDK